MRTVIRRTLLVAVLVVIVVFAGAFLAVRWALEPGVLKAAAESRLSAALGEAVTIGTIRLSFFPPVTVYGTNIRISNATSGGAPVNGGPAAAPSLEIRAIRLHPRLASLLSRPVVIDRLDIEGLALHVRRDRSGRWLLPLPATSPGASESTDAVQVSEVRLEDGRVTMTDDRSNGRGTPGVVTPIDKIAATVERTDTVMQLRGLTAAVGRSQVAGNGSVSPEGLRLTLQWTDLKQPDLPLVFALAGIAPPANLSIEGKKPMTLDLRAGRNGDVSASGTIAADRVALGTLTLTSFRSPVAFSSNRVTLDPITFQGYAAGGRGRATLNLASAPLAWAVDANLRHLDVNEFLSANTTAKDRVSGTGSVDARLHGTSRAPFERSLAGTASTDLANGAVRDFPLVAAIYSALRIGGTPDRDLHFQTLTATFELADGRATTNDLVAKTGELTLTAAGTIGFDQAIAMKGLAAFSRSKSDEFVHSIKELSSLRNGSGEIEVPFTIGGTAATPRFSIDVVGLARRGIEQELKRRLGDRLRDLFKKKK